MHSRKTIYSLLIITILLLSGCKSTNDSIDVTAPPEITIDHSETDDVTQSSDEDDTFHIEDLSAASTHTQLILVTTAGTSTTDATVTYYQKDGDTWSEVFSVGGHVGVDGIGEASEYVSRTPVGLYHFTMAFGRNSDPGTSISYTQVDDSDYWVDDPDSSHYNQFVSTDNTEVDWDSAEHLAACGDSYNYALALDYNSSCVPGAGSAIFLHCYAGVPSQGCITIPQEYMVTLLQNISSDCGIIIDTESNISTY